MTMMALDRSAIAGVMESVLPLMPEADIRLVGKSSSVLRGIPLEANDIDVLFRTRSAIDESIDALRSDVVVEVEPRWIPHENQYFARALVEGVSVELSTVEVATDDDTIECIGAGPWVHFDLVPYGAAVVAAVASELRLLSEFARGREDRYRPIIRFLEGTGCDFELIRRGLVRLGTSEGVIEQLAARLCPSSGG